MPRRPVVNLPSTRRLSVVLTVLASLLASVLASVSVSVLTGPPARARAATPAPWTVLSAQSLVRPGTVHDPAGYRGHFQVQGFPGDTYPGELEVVDFPGHTVVIDDEVVRSPCPVAGTPCSDVWDVWLPRWAQDRPPAGRYDVRLTIHSGDLPGGGAGQSLTRTIGRVTLQRLVNVDVTSRSRARPARVLATRRVGACSSERVPGRRLGRGSVGLYSETSCVRHRHRAGQVQQVFSITGPRLAGAEHLAYGEAGVQLSLARRHRGRVRVWVRSAATGPAWKRCQVSQVHGGLRPCLLPWTDVTDVRPTGVVQVRVRATGGSRVEVGSIVAHARYVVWTSLVPS